MYGKADVQEQQNYLLLVVLTTVVTACSIGDTVQNMMDHSQGGSLDTTHNAFPHFLQRMEL